MLPGHGGGAGAGAAAAVRRDREGRARGHIAEVVAVTVEPVHDVRLADAGGDGRAGRAQGDVVERSPLDRQSRGCISLSTRISTGYLVRARLDRAADIDAAGVATQGKAGVTGDVTRVIAGLVVAFGSVGLDASRNDPRGGGPHRGFLSRAGRD